MTSCWNGRCCRIYSCSLRKFALVQTHRFIPGTERHAQSLITALSTSLGHAAQDVPILIWRICFPVHDKEIVWDRRQWQIDIAIPGIRAWSEHSSAFSTFVETLPSDDTTAMSYRNFWDTLNTVKPSGLTKQDGCNGTKMVRLFVVVLND